MEQAIEKLKKEMDGNKSHPYIQVIGEFLLKHIEENPDDAEMILAENKSIAKSLEAMKEEARKKIHDGMAMLTDQEGFTVVLDYFRKEEMKKEEPEEKEMPKEQTEAEEKPIEKMTLPELKKYAAKNSIDLKGATKKADILKKIKGKEEQEEDDFDFDALLE